MQNRFFVQNDTNDKLPRYYLELTSEPQSRNKVVTLTMFCNCINIARANTLCGKTYVAPYVAPYEWDSIAIK